MISVEVTGIDKLDLKLKKVNQNLANFPSRFNQLANDFAKALETPIVKEAPVKSGKFASGLTVVARGGGKEYGLFLVSKSDLLQIILKGTKPHVIMPKNKNGVLVFKGKSGMVFTKRVNHPGTKPNDFKTRGAAKARPQLKQLLVELRKDLLK